MWISIAISIIATVIILIQGLKKGAALKLSFIIIFLFMGLRFNYGNDYLAYLNFFQTIGQFSYDYFTNLEIGWAVICWLCQPIGFFGMVLLLSALECYFIYTFIKRYINEKYYWLAVYIFTMSPSFMLIGLSMMRQFLVMCIFLYAIKFIINRDWLKYFSIIILLFTLHKSSIILSFAYFLPYLDTFHLYKHSKTFISLFLVIIALLPLLLRDTIFRLLDHEGFAYYSVYIQDKEYISFFAVNMHLIVRLIFISCFIFLADRINNKIRILFYISLCSYIFIALASIIPLIGRLSYYFLFVTIGSIPIVFHELRNGISKRILISVYMIALLYSNISFFHDETWTKDYMNYSTIFSSNSWL